MTTAETPAGLDMPRLQRWFDTHVPECSGRLQARLIQGGRSNLTYAIDDGHTRWVLRRPPLGTLTPSAHDMSREYRVVAALYGNGVPVARPAGLCEDSSVLGAPFAVVGYVDGMVIRSAADAALLLPALQRSCALALVDQLAAIHRVDPHAVGLADFGRSEGYLVRQLKRWRGQWDLVATRETPQLERLHGALSHRLPPVPGSGIVHGDYRLDNTILDRTHPDDVRAVVDWEMATLGDPLADLGMLLVYWDTVTEPVLGVRHILHHNPGFPTAAELAERYAERTGADLSHLRFYQALGYFKLAVIAEGIHARHLEGRTVGEGFHTIGDAVLPLLQAGLATLTRQDTA
ncbi:phosphotransferase family protein [Streptomyces caniscabiei]|uniref:phosphotransferase family protein n=1 Tax=Streptomyces caniscabiei TaxID=2746961 RepID=UPI0029BBC00A|nr:phosphotransferase family protein [Streptomyces caniscabiei]MDX2600326.1 phosphotransferase family protein [Streptomyces caniscabiei]